MRVLIVDDHPILGDAFAKYVEQLGSQVSETPVTATSTATLAEAISAISADVGRPDLVFLDLNLDAENKSLVTLERFQEANQHGVSVVVFTGISLHDDGAVEIFRRHYVFELRLAEVQ
jgi:CheY-like chemotaxis protein